MNPIWRPGTEPSTGSQAEKGRGSRGGRVEKLPQNPRQTVEKATAETAVRNGGT